MLTLSPKSFYEPNFFSDDEANAFFDFFNNIDGWNKNLFNNYKLNRETIVFASDEIFDNPEKFAIPPIWGDKVKVLRFPSVMKVILAKLKEISGSNYNIVLGNRYLRPKDKIAQHSDNEEFGNTQSIASISLGVPRMFHFKSKVYNNVDGINECNETKSILLEHGSLLFMGENCQENYTHGMRNDKIEPHPVFNKTRINLTFRIWNY